jgi:serine/threonine protein kinase
VAGTSRDIAKYTDATLIGRGGFGSVYRADDPQHGREVAIKVLQGELGATERRRFDRERQTMGRLGSHPNIVPVYESGYTDDGEGYIVMELASGGSLRDRLEAQGRLPWVEAAGIMAAIARAAHAAHEQGVLHRDIKPDNILIDAYGNPKLTDFGIAAVASNATATTTTTATVAHAAPEVLQGQESTEAVDIYAIGSTFYNLVTGLPPFQRPGDQGVPPIIKRALTDPPPDLRRYGVPDALARVAEQSLAKDRHQRQATAAQLADELEASSGADPTAPLPPPGSGPAAAETVIASGPPPSRSREATPSQGLVGAPGSHLAGLPPPPGQRPAASPAASSTGNPSAAPAGYQHLPAPPATAGSAGTPPAADYRQIPPGGVAGSGTPTGYQQFASVGGGPTPVPPTTSSGGGGGVGGRVLLVVGVVLVAGLITAGVVAAALSGDDEPDVDSIAGGSSTSTSTEATTTTSTTSSTTTTSTTVPIGAAFDGVIFEDAFLSWTSYDIPYTAIVNTDGFTGTMIVTYFDIDDNFVDIELDLTLTTFAGSWAYEGSNPRFAFDQTPVLWDPEILLMYEGDDGFWYFDQVCMANGDCVFIDE